MKTYMYQNSDAQGTCTHNIDHFNIMLYHLKNVYVMQIFQ